MPVPLDNGHRLVAVGTDLFHLPEGRAGHHKGHAPLPVLLQQLFPPQGQAVAVHRHHGELPPLRLKEHAGMDGAALVVADGKGGLPDHGAQGALGHFKPPALVHLGQLGEVLVAAAHNVKGGGAALDVDGAALGGDGNHVVRHPAQYFPQQPGGEHNGAALRHAGGDAGDNAGLQIVPADAQAVPPGFDQHALQRLDGAFGVDHPAGGGDGGLENGLFTGEFHSLVPFSLLRKERKG